MHPKQIRDTVSPVLPSLTYFIQPPLLGIVRSRSRRAPLGTNPGAVPRNTFLRRVKRPAAHSPARLRRSISPALSLSTVASPAAQRVDALGDAPPAPPRVPVLPSPSEECG